MSTTTCIILSIISTVMFTLIHLLDSGVDL